MDKGFSTMLLCMQSDLKKIPSQLSFTYRWMVSPQFGPQVSPSESIPSFENPINKTGDGLGLTCNSNSFLVY